MTKPRCVVDTNVLICGALSKHGKPRKVVDFIDASGIILSSQATFEEFDTRIRRKKFDKYFVDPHEREEYIDWIYEGRWSQQRRESPRTSAVGGRVVRPDQSPPVT